MIPGKLDSSGNKISMGWGNSPEYMLLWQIKCARYSIVESFMDADFEKIHNRSFSQMFPILSSWTIGKTPSVGRASN